MICQKCGKRTRKSHKHHITPRSEGGSDAPDNLMILCVNCHRALHSANNDFRRWGKRGGEKQALTLSWLHNLKQFQTDEDRLEWVRLNRPEMLSTYIESIHKGGYYV